MRFKLNPLCRLLLFFFILFPLISYGAYRPGIAEGAALIKYPSSEIWAYFWENSKGQIIGLFQWVFVQNPFYFDSIYGPEGDVDVGFMHGLKDFSGSNTLVFKSRKSQLYKEYFKIYSFTKIEIDEFFSLIAQGSDKLSKIYRAAIPITGKVNVGEVRGEWTIVTVYIIPVKLQYEKNLKDYFSITFQEKESDNKYTFYLRPHDIYGFSQVLEERIRNMLKHVPEAENFLREREALIKELELEG